MSKIRFFFFSLFLIPPLLAQATGGKSPVLVRKPRSPTNNNALIMLLQNQYVKPNDALVVRTRSIPVGDLTSSNPSLQLVQRPKRLVDILTIIDGKEAFIYTYKDGSPFIESRRYFHHTYTKRASEIPSLSTGPHAVVVIVRNSYGETVKLPTGFDAMVLSYNQPPNMEELKKVGTELDIPQLIYNEPQGRFFADAPVLLDFYLLNALLSKTEYKVNVYLDGALVSQVYQWVPYFFKNVSVGSHTVKLELVDNQGNIVPNPFGVAVEGSFDVDLPLPKKK